jgi:hypothetical protein
MAPATSWQSLSKGFQRMSNKMTPPPSRDYQELLSHALSGDDSARFEALAAQMRALTAGTRQTRSEDLLRQMRDER